MGDKPQLHVTPEQLQRMWNELEAIFEQVMIEYWRDRAPKIVRSDELTKEQFIASSNSFYLSSMPRIMTHLAGRMLSHTIIGLATPETTGMVFDPTGKVGPVGAEALATMVRDDIVWELERCTKRVEAEGSEEWLEEFIPGSSQHMGEIVDMCRRVAGMLRGS